MPADRVSESYEIYSQLLVGKPIESRKAVRSQWLVEDTTHAAPLNEVCHPLMAPGSLMSPYVAVTAPEDRKADWHDLLADFDLHCHDVVRLDADSFHLALPVHLLNDADRGHYRLHPSDFPGAAGLHHFSEVYFNPQHTLALVSYGVSGSWTWFVLERKGGGWKILPWAHVVMAS